MSRRAERQCKDTAEALEDVLPEFELMLIRVESCFDFDD